MKFVKMHGAGNDYVYVNGLEEWVPDPGKTSIKISDRHFGVGGDGLVLIIPSDIADFRMRMFNADGSEGEMCGNAIRCVAKYVYDRGMTRKKELRVETFAGIRTLKLFTDGSGLVEKVRVWMGQPVFSDQKEMADMLSRSFPALVTVADAVYALHCVSVGNPHAVVLVEDVTNFPVATVGSRIQQLPMFPRQVNVEFIRIRNRSDIQMRVWERGSGETLACGTGACAAAAAAMRMQMVDRQCRVHLLGGILDISWEEDGLYMTGPATTVFEGNINL